MKIGIVTLPLRINYGGLLQSYALNTTLHRLGHDSTCLCTPYPALHAFKPAMLLRYGKRILRKYVLGRKHVCIFIEKFQEKQYSLISQNTQQFIDNYIPYTDIATYADAARLGLDAIIVGSDQVWRPRYFKGRITDAYLAFTQGWNIRRIAYAASFGTDAWEYTPRETDTCRQLLSAFNHVSVREQQAVGLCQEHFGIQAEWVLDPTLLLTADDYRPLCTGRLPDRNQGLFAYILDETDTTRQMCDTLANRLGTNSLTVKSPVEKWYLPLEERIVPPVGQWLRAFADARFVFTDSFHGCVFSIIFNKPFVVCGNNRRGMSRFTSLLSMFGLESRLVTDAEAALKAAAEPIDWTTVNARLEQRRQLSLEFLTRALS